MWAKVLGIGLSLGFLFACSGADEGTPGNPGGGSPGGSGCEGRGESFSAGMTKVSDGGGVNVVLVKSDIAPPGQGINTWTLRLTDAAGQPIEGARVSASFLMPDHTHPAQHKDARETERGTYQVAPYFSMPGFWETTVTVTPAGGAESSVRFSFCIAQD